MTRITAAPAAAAGRVAAVAADRAGGGTRGNDDASGFTLGTVLGALGIAALLSGFALALRVRGFTPNAISMVVSGAALVGAGVATEVHRHPPARGHREHG